MWQWKQTAEVGTGNYGMWQHVAMGTEVDVLVIWYVAI